MFHAAELYQGVNIHSTNAENDAQRNLLASWEVETLQDGQRRNGNTAVA